MSIMFVLGYPTPVLCPFTSSMMCPQLMTNEMEPSAGLVSRSWHNRKRRLCSSWSKCCMVLPLILVTVARRLCCFLREYQQANSPSPLWWALKYQTFCSSGISLLICFSFAQGKKIRKTALDCLFTQLETYSLVVKTTGKCFLQLSVTPVNLELCEEC